MAKHDGELQGFMSVEEHCRRDEGKVFLNVRARGKCGKTHFCGTLPRPIAYYNIDMSTRGVLDEYRGDKDIHIFPIEYEPSDQAATMKTWEDFLDSWDAVMRGKYFRSVVVDTQDELLVVQRLAYFGNRRASQFEYATPNAEFLNLFKMYHACDKILVVTTKMDKEYKEKKTTGRSGKTSTQSEWTGKYVPKGKTELEEYLPELNVELYKFDIEGGEPGKKDFGLQIDKCRIGTGVDLEGELLEGRDEVSFPLLMAKVLPKVDPREWR
jgi:hypothetical protein